MTDIPATPSTTPTEVRMLIRGSYDLQKLRIMMGNRICGQFKAKLGQPPGVSEEESLDDESAKTLDVLRAEFKKLTDGVKQVRLATFKASPIISTFTEFALLQSYLELEETENRNFAAVKKVLHQVPIYTNFLLHVEGCGPQMAGVIISEVDIAQAKYVSSLWQFAGLGVEADGRATSRRKEHMHKIDYTDKEGKQQTRMGIRYNPWLRTKLIGVLAGCMIKAGMVLKKVDDPKNPGKQISAKDDQGNSIPIYGECSKYVQIYLDYKNRMKCHAVHGIQNDEKMVEREVKKVVKPGEKGEPGYEMKKVPMASPGHRNAMAIRYMIKMFLKDLYVEWRTLEGLPVAPSYQEAKLGHTHGAA